MKTFITNTKAGNDIKQTFIDLTNQRFGKLVVLELDKSTQFFRHKKWICQCDCGKTKSIRGDALKGGLTKSCGCIAKEKSIENIKKEIKYFGKHYIKPIIHKKANLNI